MDFHVSEKSWVRLAVKAGEGCSYELHITTKPVHQLHISDMDNTSTQYWHTITKEI